LFIDNGYQMVGGFRLFRGAAGRFRRGAAALGLLALVLLAALPARAQFLGVLDAEALREVVAARRGKVVVVNFWATWCAPCMEELPEMAALRAAFGPQELFMAGVSMDFDPEAPARFALRYNPGYPLYLAGDDIPRAFGVGAIPRTMIWGPDGKKAGDHVGVLDRRMLIGTVGGLLGRPEP